MVLMLIDFNKLSISFDKTEREHLLKFNDVYC